MNGHGITCVCETSISAQQQQQQQQQTECMAAVNIKQPKSNAQRIKECKLCKKETHIVHSKQGSCMLQDVILHQLVTVQL
jgi:hypothetical protein